MKRTGTILIIGIPLIILLLSGVIYEYGYLEVRSELTDMQDAESAKLKTLEKYMAVIAEGQTLEKNLAALKELRKAQDAKIIEGQTAAIAAAALQSAIKEMIASRGGSIASERVEKPEEAGGFRMITVTVDAVLPDIRALADALRAVETQTPYLTIREMDVRIRNIREPKDLTVKLKVSGLTGGR